MTRTLPKLERTTPLDAIPTGWLIVGVIVLTLIIMLIATAIISSEAAAEAATSGEEYIFDAEDMYETWSWLVVAGVFGAATVYGFKQRLPFASVIQVALIIVLTANFILIAQQIDRDIYGVGVFALIIFTLVQIAFSNISPQANFRQSLVGFIITVIVLAAIVAFSIWLVPSLIQLGQ